MVSLAVALLLQLDPCASGMQAFAERKWTAAQSWLWQCVASGAKDREPAWQLAQTYRELRSYEEGARRAAAMPGSQDLLVIRAFLAFRRQKHDESIALLGRAFRADNYDWRVHWLFAVNYIALDIREGARYELEVAAKLRPNDAEIFYYQGRLEYIENRFAEAIAAFQRAIALAPDYTAAHTNLALSYEGTGDLARAAEHHRRAIEVARAESPIDEWPFLNYAAMLTRGTEPKSALPVLEDALRASPHSARVRLYLGRLYRRLEEWDEALAQFELACELDPADADAHYALATALLRKGDRIRGQQLMERFATLKKKPSGTHP